ncbi:peptide-methionine (S)-S-oxide reductase [Aequorivita echinoideorum]|uniref:peptide-methionine (S)-S-oxide reductase n=1 Tax=Aequorivita echinoideorum TaxID=1549647 RepID=A0ABS5S660_9FLAO|nr:peptide-methionine (S)-S-oxide reductase [Aequorivita echinoideorum]
MLSQIALGGGCHWCTEAVFQSLIGVQSVSQGFVASTGENENFSEAILISFKSKEISLETLIEIHLHTHKSTVNHRMRKKYRSAIYYFSEVQKTECISILKKLQNSFDDTLITQILPFHQFQSSREELLNYYYSDVNRPFCQKYIKPKLQLLLDKFSENVSFRTNEKNPNKLPF